MANQRRLNASGSSRPAAAPAPGRNRLEPTRAATPARSFSRFTPRFVTISLLSATIVYLAYYPSDSIAVEQGDALWFGVLSLLGLIASSLIGRHRSQPAEQVQRGSMLFLFDAAVTVLPWVLASWMMVAALATSPPGNLRSATNEAWLWVSFAALFTAARRVTILPSCRPLLLALFVVCGVGLSVHGLYQQSVTLPRNQEAFLEDPEAVLAAAGVEAPPGSAERMVFRNRLFDGGPTGTFALANSLAGVLLVALVVSVATLRSDWFVMRGTAKVGWIAAIGLCGSCLVATRSRSALLAMLVGVFLTAAYRSGRPAKNRRRIWIAAVGISLILVAVAVGLALLGDPEWFEQAPASVTFRLQYWRSTLEMVFERPLFGSGPGNFQAIYERFRLPSMHEQIAEPHNFLFETLAAGGWIGLVSLVGFLAAGVRLSQMRTRASSHERVGESATSAGVLGALVALLLVWLLSGLSGRFPDVEAHLFAVPAALLIGYAILPGATAPGAAEATRPVQLPVLAALIALLVHLCAAGGWTVPGVGAWAWLLIAMMVGPSPKLDVATQGRASASGRASVGWRWSGVLGMGAAAVLLIALYLLSLKPVEQRQLAMMRAERDQAAGRIAATESHLLSAMEIDPWSAEPALWLADFYRWQMVTNPFSTETRRRWQSAIESAKRRAGADPAAYRMIGGQQIHLYQRYGDYEDLLAAEKSFTTAARWSPSHQWLAAQVAVIAQALGREEKQRIFAERAERLSRLGNNIERALKRQLIYEPKPAGERARLAPIRRPASELFANQRTAAAVAAENQSR